MPGKVTSGTSAKTVKIKTTFKSTPEANIHDIKKLKVPYAKENDPLVRESEKVIKSFLLTLTDDRELWNLLEQNKAIPLDQHGALDKMERRISNLIEKKFLRFLNTNNQNPVGRQFLKELLKTDRMMFTPAYIGPSSALSQNLAQSSITTYSESGISGKDNFKRAIQSRSFYSEAEEIQQLTALRSEEYAGHCYNKYLPKLSATPAAAAASATRKKAAQGLQNLEDTSYGKAPASDASKPAGGKKAKVKALKKPSGGARKHDPNAKNVRGKRARTSSKFTRWGTRVLKWEIEK